MLQPETELKGAIFVIINKARIGNIYWITTKLTLELVRELLTEPFIGTSMTLTKLTLTRNGTRNEQSALNKI